MPQSTEVSLKIIADAANAIRQAGALVRSYKAAGRDIERAMDRVGRFEALQQSTGELAGEVDQARQRFAAMGDELASLDAPTNKQRMAHKRAGEELDALQRKLDRQNARLAESRAALEADGVETRDLAAEKAKLADQLKRTADAAAAESARVRERQRVQAARDTIGVPDTRAARREILRLQAAYNRLARSGTASAAELRAAQARVRDQIRALRAETSGWARNVDTLRGSWAQLVGLFAGFRVLSAGATRAAEFGRAIAEVSTLLADTGELDTLTESVRELSVAFGQDATDQARALYQVISAGASDAATATDVLTTANRLALGGVTDVTTAADGLTSILNAYGSEAGTAAGVSDALFIAMRNGKTTIGELSGSIGQVAPIAATAGVALSDLLAAIAAVTKGGVATSEAVTAMRGVLSAVIKPTSAARQAAEQLGIGFDVASLRAQGLAGFLESIQAAAGGNEQVLGQLFGRVEGLSAVFALTGNQAESFSQLLGDMATRTGATEAAVARMTEGAGAAAFQAGRFKAALADLSTTFGQAITAATPALQLLTRLLNTFGRLPDAVQQAAVAIPLLSAAVVLARVPVVALTGAVAAMAGQMTAATGATTRLAAGLAMLRRGAGLALAAFAGFAVGDYLREQFRVARDAGIYLVRYLLTGAETIKGGFRSIGPAISLAVGAAIDNARQNMAEFIDTVGRQLARLPDRLGGRLGRQLQARAAEMRAAGSGAVTDQAAAEVARIARETLAEIARVRAITDAQLAEGMTPDAATTGALEQMRADAAAVLSELDAAENAHRARQLTADTANAEARAAARLDVQARLLDAQGDSEAAALARLRAEFDTLRETLAGDAEALALVDKLFDLEAAKLAADALAEQTADRLAGIQQAIGDALAGQQATAVTVGAEVDAGTESRAGAADRLSESAEVTRDRLAELRADLVALLATDPPNAAAVVAQIQRVDDALGEADKQATALVASLATAVEGELATAFTAILDGTRSVGDAFAAMGDAVVKQLQRIIAETLAAAAVQSLLQAFGVTPAGRADGGSVEGRADGGPVRGPIEGRANGGPVRGPGGPTQDKVPAFVRAGGRVKPYRLSPGEWIIPARRVLQYGAAAMERLRTGQVDPAVLRMRNDQAEPRAEGGPVESAPAGGVSSAARPVVRGAASPVLRLVARVRATLVQARGLLRVALRGQGAAPPADPAGGGPVPAAGLVREVLRTSAAVSRTVSEQITDRATARRVERERLLLERQAGGQPAGASADPVAMPPGQAVREVLRTSAAVSRTVSEQITDRATARRVERERLVLERQAGGQPAGASADPAAMPPGQAVREVLRTSAAVSRTVAERVTEQAAGVQPQPLPAEQAAGPVGGLAGAVARLVAVVDTLAMGARQAVAPMGQAAMVLASGPAATVNSPAMALAGSAALMPAAGDVRAGGGVNVTVNNRAGDAVQARARRSQDGEDGSLNFEVIVERIDSALGGRIARGQGATNGALESVFGLNRSAGSLR